MKQLDKETDVFKTYRLSANSPKALVGTCVDNKFPFEDFLGCNLGLPEGHRILLKTPGGLAPLIYREIIPAWFEVAKGSMGLLLRRNPGIATLILIGHSDGCAFYDEFLPDFRDRVREDLPLIGNIAMEIFAQIRRVELYYASSRPDDTVEFEPVLEAVLQTA